MNVKTILAKQLEKAGYKDVKIQDEGNGRLYVSVTTERQRTVVDKILDVLKQDIETDSEKTYLHGVRKIQSSRVPGTNQQLNEFELEFRTVSTLIEEIN